MRGVGCVLMLAAACGGDPMSSADAMVSAPPDAPVLVDAAAPVPDAMIDPFVCDVAFTVDMIPVAEGDPYEVALADIDGDDHLDAVVTITGSSPSSSSGIVLRGLAIGTLEAIAAPFGSVFANRVAAGDLDADGDNDVVVGAWNWAADPRWFLNDGDGVLESDGIGPYSAMALLAVELDGVPGAEIVVVDSDEGVVIRETVIPILGARGIAAGDLDGDDDLDLVVPHFGADGAGGIWTIRNEGAGDFSLQGQFTTPVGLVEPELADVDEDGDLDVVALQGEEVLVAFGDGTGDVGEPVLMESQGARLLTVGDVNGDAHADIAASTGTTGVSVWIGRGDGTFCAPASVTVPDTTYGIVAGDLDKDGRDELVVTSWDFGVGVLRSIP